MANQYLQQGNAGSPHPPPNMAQQVPRPATANMRDYQQASASPANNYNRPALYPQHSSGYQSQGTPAPPRQDSPYGTAQQLHPAAPYVGANQPQAYNNAAAAQPYQPRQTIQQVQAQQAAQYQQQPVPQPVQAQQQYPQYPAAPIHERHHETYVLSDAANAAIPKDIRDRFPQDDEGRVLFFTRPPLVTDRIVTGRSKSEQNRPLAHSKEYLDAKEERNKLIKERKRAIQESLERKSAANGGDYKRLKIGTFGEEREADGRIRADPDKAAEILQDHEAKQAEKARKEEEEAAALQQKALEELRKGMVQSTAAEYRMRYGDKALEYFEEDTARTRDRELLWRQQQAMRQQNSDAQLSKDDKIRADTKRMLSQNFWTGRYYDGTGRFEDDYDNRLPRPS
jgi:chromatin structure-remodeling complex subunit RSC1/2